jgi:hypothetical protein
MNQKEYALSEPLAALVGDAQVCRPYILMLQSLKLTVPSYPDRKLSKRFGSILERMISRTRQISARSFATIRCSKFLSRIPCICSP